MVIRVIKKIENMFQTEKRPSGYPTYLVMCSECWKQFPMIRYDIWKTEYCTSCANKLRGQWKNKGIKRHYMKKSHFYRKRVSMKIRCNYPKTHWFKNYGGRGIKCEWDTFEEFKRDMYESYLEFIKDHWEKETTLDRIDVNWNYNKDNCRWETMLEQQSNKRNNHRVIYKWKEYPTIKWLCELMWKNYSRVFRRITTYWWSVEDAIDK
jgi:hypothetical protein